MLNRIGCGFSALSNDFETKSAPCWWSMDRIGWFVWKSFDWITSCEQYNKTAVIQWFTLLSHHLSNRLTTFNQACWFPLGLGGRAALKCMWKQFILHLKRIICTQQQTFDFLEIVVESLLVLLIASFEHNPGDCHHCCLQCDGLLPGGLVWLGRAALFHAGLGNSRSGAIAGKQV